jgi:hypothetical protein
MQWLRTWNAQFVPSFRQALRSSLHLPFVALWSSSDIYVGRTAFWLPPLVLNEGSYIFKNIYNCWCLSCLVFVAYRFYRILKLNTRIATSRPTFSAEVYEVILSPYRTESNLKISTVGFLSHSFRLRYPLYSMLRSICSESSIAVPKHSKVAFQYALTSVSTSHCFLGCCALLARHCNLACISHFSDNQKLLRVASEDRKQVNSVRNRSPTKFNMAVLFSLNSRYKMTAPDHMITCVLFVWPFSAV